MPRRVDSTHLRGCSRAGQFSGLKDGSRGPQRQQRAPATRRSRRIYPLSSVNTWPPTHNGEKAETEGVSLGHAQLCRPGSSPLSDTLVKLLRQGTMVGSDVSGLACTTYSRQQFSVGTRWVCPAVGNDFFTGHPAVSLRGTAASRTDLLLSDEVSFERDSASLWWDENRRLRVDFELLADKSLLFGIDVQPLSAG